MKKMLCDPGFCYMISVQISGEEIEYPESNKKIWGGYH
jgi:hypothetical protein